MLVTNENIIVATSSHGAWKVAKLVGPFSQSGTIVLKYQIVTQWLALN
jgi:hypothetical protein